MIDWTDGLIFGCLASSFLLGAIAVRRLATPAAPEAPLRRTPDTRLHSEIGLGEALDDWLEQTTARSGLPFDALTVLTGALAFGTLVGFAAYLFEVAIHLAAVIGLTASAFVLAIVAFVAARRGKKFVEQFPVAIDMIARAVMAGESFEEGIQSAVETAKEPVLSELRRVSQDLDLGYPLAKTMLKFAKRNPYVDVKIFGHTVALHREMGGRLGETLLRLSCVIRQRAEYVRKIESATSLGRFASVGIGAIGMFALVYLLMVHPDYVGKLWTSETGRRMIYYAATSELIGIVWAMVTLKQQY